MIEEKTLADLGILIDEQCEVINRQKAVINDLLALLAQHVSTEEMERLYKNVFN